MAKTLNVKVGIGLSLVGGILAGMSVFLYGWDGWYRVPPSRTEKAVHLVILCLWIVVPPVWFAFEPLLLKSGANRDELRKGQEPYSRIWVGVSAMLGVLASALLKS
jgi:hypothetical protein